MGLYQPEFRRKWEVAWTNGTNSAFIWGLGWVSLQGGQNLLSSLYYPLLNTLFLTTGLYCPDGLCTLLFLGQNCPQKDLDISHLPVSVPVGHYDLPPKASVH